MTGVKSDALDDDYGDPTFSEDVYAALDALGGMTPGRQATMLIALIDAEIDELEAICYCPRFGSHCGCSRYGERHEPPFDECEVERVVKEVDWLIAGWNRAQRRGARDLVADADAALLAGDVAGADRLVAEARSAGLGLLEATEPPPKPVVIPIDHVAAERRVDALVAAAAAPPA